MSVMIELNGSVLEVQSPYNSDFVVAAKRLGGKWCAPAWLFDVRDEARVRALCQDVYGSDGMVADTVTLRIEWRREDSADRGPIEINGRPIARAFGRDSGAKLADGVVVLAGGFRSGGSVKNWTSRVVAGTIVLVRDFPRAAANALVEAQTPEHCRAYTIEPEAPAIDHAALEAERARIVARLTEIDQLLRGA